MLKIAKVNKVLFISFIVFCCSIAAVSSTYGNNMSYLRKEIFSTNFNDDNHRDNNITSKNGFSDTHVPPLNFWRIGGELAAGFIVESKTMDVFKYFNQENSILNWNVYGFGIIPDVGIMLADQLCVFAIGSIGNETGSLKRAILYGIAISCGIQLISLSVYDLYGYFKPADSTANSVFCLNLAMYSAPIIGAVVGFNLTRRYKTVQSKGEGLISINDGKLSFDFPKLFGGSIEQSPLVGVNLVNLKF